MNDHRALVTKVSDEQFPSNVGEETAENQVAVVRKESKIDTSMLQAKSHIQPNG